MAKVEKEWKRYGILLPGKWWKKYGCSAFRIVHHGGAEDASFD